MSSASQSATTRAIVPAILLAALCGSFGKTYPWSLLGDAGRLMWVLGAAGVAVLALPGVRTPLHERATRALAQRSWLVVWALGTGVFSLASWAYFRRLGYEFPVGTLVLALLCAALVRPDRLWPACLLSLGCLALSMVHCPLVVERSDMLPGIERTLTVWSRGGDPYALDRFSGGALVRMAYLPGTFFSHLPAWALGLDLRWNQLLYRAAWMAILAARLRREPAGSPWRGLFQWYLLNPYVNWRHDLYFEAFLLLIAAYHLFPPARWLVLPALVITRQWAWVMAPFLLAERWRSQGLRSLVAPAAGSLVVGAAVLAALWGRTTWSTFVANVFWFDQVLDYPRFMGDYGLSLAPALYWMGLAEAIPFLQGACCAAALWFGWRRGAFGLPSWGVWALLAFVMLNGHYWNYFWLSPVLWMMSGGLTAQRPGNRLDQAPRPGRTAKGGTWDIALSALPRAALSDMLPRSIRSWTGSRGDRE